MCSSCLLGGFDSSAYLAIIWHSQVKVYFSLPSFLLQPSRSKLTLHSAQLFRRGWCWYLWRKRLKPSWGVLTFSPAAACSKKKVHTLVEFLYFQYVSQSLCGWTLLLPCNTIFFKHIIQYLTIDIEQIQIKHTFNSLN